MDNQQPSTLESRIKTLALNARLGDGYLWKHPECRNYKVIYTSVTPELLEVKQSIAPELFSSGVDLIRFKKGKDYGHFPNAKPIYRLASRVHPLFTEYAAKAKEDVYKELGIEDFALWYLDDGCCVARREYKDSVYYRFYLSIGDCCSTPQKMILFKNNLRRIFGLNFGSIQKNNSKATENNKSWIIPVQIAKLILERAKKYGILPAKFPW